MLAGKEAKLFRRPRHLHAGRARTESCIHRCMYTHDEIGVRQPESNLFYIDVLTNDRGNKKKKWEERKNNIKLRMAKEKVKRIRIPILRVLNCRTEDMPLALQLVAFICKYMYIDIDIFVCVCRGWVAVCEWGCEFM